MVVGDLMSRAIRFTKAEMEAVVEGIQCAEEARGTKACVKGLESLLAKMKAASDPEQAKVTEGLPASSFCEMLGKRVVLPQTKASWAILQKAVHTNKWTIEDVTKLDLSWARSPIPALSVANKGKDWLARQQATPTKAGWSAPADMEFDDE